MGSVDWKWLIIGLLLGWMGIPFLMGKLAARRAG